MPRARTALFGLLVGFAASLGSAEDAELERIRDRLATTLPDVLREDIVRAPVSGLFEVRRGYAYGYVTADGETLIIGDLIDLSGGRELTEQRRRQQRLADIQTVGGEIVFAPPGGPADPARTLTVFTDVDCGYCRQLHREMADYHARGIAIRYLFFPRSGPGSRSYRDAQAVSCADDPRQALTTAKSGGRLARPAAGCTDSVAAQFALSQALQLDATPALVFPDGRLEYGYRSAAAVDQSLREGAAP